MPSRSDLAIAVALCCLVAPATAEQPAVFAAARAGDLATVRAALAADPELRNAIDAQPWDQPSLLHIAVSARQAAMVDLLLADGADPEQLDGRGTPAIFATIHHPDEELLAKLLDAGADINAVDSFGYTMLHYVVADARLLHHASYLVERGADVNVASAFGITPTHVAPLEMLLAADAKVSARDWQGRTPAFTAGPLQLAALQARGALLDVSDVNGWTLLHEAAWQDRTATVQYLLAQGLDVAARDARGWTPLHAAAHVGGREIAALLLARGADPRRPDDAGTTPAKLAAQHAHDRLLELFAGPVAENSTIAGELLAERPTLSCLGFKWYIGGDANRNATVRVEFRRRGSFWRDFYPALRIGGEISGLGWVTPSMFAGSVLDLAPGTDYELRLTLSDPDNPQPIQQTLAMRTRAEPAAATDGRQLHVYAKDFGGARQAPAFADVQAAYAGAEPGDVILVHAGNHQQDLVFDKQATADRPIVIRGVGEAQLQGIGNEVINVDGSRHHIIEDLTIYDADTAILARGSTVGLTVRRCHFHSCRRPVYAISPDNRDFLICDNIMVGPAQDWHPRDQQLATYGKSQGVWLSGQGHVVCYNEITRYWDGLSITGAVSQDRELQNCAIDFYNNEMREFIDDAIEMDYGVHNIRVFRNRIHNTFMGISTQPVEGGPGYIWQNQIYGTVNSPLKLNQQPSGLMIFHNTLVGEQRAFPAAAGWQNCRLYNNLFIGFAGEWVISGGTPTPQTSRLDFNGYRFFETGRPFPIHWQRAQPWYTPSGGGISRELVAATLTDFSRALPSQFERHGTVLDTDVLIACPPPTPSRDRHARPVYDLALRGGGAAVDAGIRLPGFNDDFAGLAPDLGALELGAAWPHYGPRPEPK